MDRVIEKIIELLQTHVATPHNIKAIYNGRVKQIPGANFPAIIVMGESMESRVLDNVRNVETYRIKILLAQDERNFVGQDITKTTTEREIRKIFEERVAGGNEFKDSTIMSVILKEFMYTDTFSLNTIVNNIEFGEDLDTFLSVNSPGFYGAMDITVTATPARIK